MNNDNQQTRARQLVVSVAGAVVTQTYLKLVRNEERASRATCSSSRY